MTINMGSRRISFMKLALFFIGDFERQNLEHFAVGRNQFQLVGERSPVCTFRQLVEHFLRKKVLEADFAAVHAQIACLSVCVHGKQGHGGILAQDTSGVFLARGDFHAAEVVGDFVTIGRKEFLFRIDGDFRVCEVVDVRTFGFQLLVGRENDHLTMKQTVVACEIYSVAQQLDLDMIPL